jgi:hypothetical protein
MTNSSATSVSSWKIRVVIQERISKTKQKACFENIIWLTLGELHRSYVWRVRILLSTITYWADVRSAGMHKDGRATDLIEITANALSDVVVAVMLLAVQKDNLEPNIKQAIKW